MKAFQAKARLDLENKSVGGRKLVKVSRLIQKVGKASEKFLWMLKRFIHKAWGDGPTIEKLNNCQRLCYGTTVYFISYQASSHFICRLNDNTH